MEHFWQHCWHNRPLLIRSHQNFCVACFRGDESRASSWSNSIRGMIHTNALVHLREFHRLFIQRLADSVDRALGENRRLHDEHEILPTGIQGVHSQARAGAASGGGPRIQSIGVRVFDFKHLESLVDGNDFRGGKTTDRGEYLIRGDRKRDRSLGWLAGLLVQFFSSCAVYIIILL